MIAYIVGRLWALKALIVSQVGGFTWKKGYDVIVKYKVTKKVLLALASNQQKYTRFTVFPPDL